MFGNLLKKAAGAYVGRVGNSLQQVGTKLNAPQLVSGGLGAQLQILGRQLNPVKEVKASDNLYNYSTAQSTYDPYAGANSNINAYKLGSYNPTTGGQGSGGNGGGADTGGGSTGGDGGDPFAKLREAFNYAKGIYEQQIPQLEGDYVRIKGDIEGAVNRSKEVLGEQINDINVGFGENLRNLLTRSKELGQKTRNIYSGLNALDSSSYGDEQIKQEQGLFDSQTKLEATKTRDEKEARRLQSGYQSKADSDLATLGKEYLAGKSALQRAIADNNIEEANSILGWMERLGSVMANAKLGAAQLASQGVDVVGNLQKLNRGGLDNIFGNYLSSIYNPSMGTMASVNATPNVGSGYISPRTGKRYGSYQDFLRAEGA